MKKLAIVILFAFLYGSTSAQPDPNMGIITAPASVKIAWSQAARTIVITPSGKRSVVMETVLKNATADVKAK